MAKIDRFYIGQLTGQGLRSDLKPFAIPDEAFSELTNAYIFRGRVRKRFGSKLMIGSDTPIEGLRQIQSRLKINIGTTSVAGDFGPFTVPGAVFENGQAFSVGDNFFTVFQNGAMETNGPGTGTYNTATGSVQITGSNPSTIVYFYPAQPVMGLITYEQPQTNAEDVMAFDTQFAYQFSNNGWERLGTAVWTGSNSKFFWGANARGTSAAAINLYVTNYNYGVSTADTDPIRYYDGSTWTNFTPSYNSGATPGQDLILTARIITFFKNRLLFLNVVENTGAAPGTNAVYANRCRYSWIGDPVNTAAFYDDVPGSGGYIDAPTKESIVTAQFLKDRLIVYFERSTWELVYTGNQIEPFVWQQINTELGAESTFSQVPFDKVVYGVGNVGIHACNGANVDRIDNKIPDVVFEIHNDNDGIERVYGIRDYFAEMVYWAFPGINRDSDYPFNNRVLVYNYKNDTWAFNDDSITCFGYFQTTTAGTLTGPTWGELDIPWDEANFAWRSAVLQAKFRNVIAGNQQGYVFIVDPTLGANSPSLQITGLQATDYQDFDGNYIVEMYITSYNHNLSDGDYIRVDNMVVDNGVAFVDSDLNDLTFKVYQVADQNNFYCRSLPLDFQPAGGGYAGCGTLQRVTPIEISTKQFNFYANSDRNAAVSKINFLVDRTEDGQCSVNFYAGTSVEGGLDIQSNTGSLVGASVLSTSAYDLAPQELNQTQLWHPVYFWSEGAYCQFRLFLSDRQAQTNIIADADFQLHAMMISATATSSRLQ